MPRAAAAHRCWSARDQVRCFQFGADFDGERVSGRGVGGDEEHALPGGDSGVRDRGRQGVCAVAGRGRHHGEAAGHRRLHGAVVGFADRGGADRDRGVPSSPRFGDVGEAGERGVAEPGHVQAFDHGQVGQQRPRVGVLAVGVGLLPRGGRAAGLAGQWHGGASVMSTGRASPLVARFR